MRKRLVGLVGAMVVAIAGTTFAGSTSQQGYVDGMTCVGYLTTTASSVVATTKCVPANSSCESNCLYVSEWSTENKYE